MNQDGGMLAGLSKIYDVWLKKGETCDVCIQLNPHMHLWMVEHPWDFTNRQLSFFIYSIENLLYSN